MPDPMDDIAPDGMAMPAEPGQVNDVLPLLREIMGHDNLAEALEDGELTRIAQEVIEEYDIDKNSMSSWYDEMKAGLDLARMVKSDRKSINRASNVCYPLVASAALQFNARAYPAIVPSGQPVYCKAQGADKSGQKAARAERVQEHLGWQLLTQITEWEPETDSLLTLLPIVGTMIRKVWYDPTLGRPRVKLCDAGAVVINDNVQSIDSAPRVSEEVSLYPHEIESRKRAGIFLNVDLGDAVQLPGDETGGEGETTAHDPSAPHMFIEQHRRIDIDGDGYPEPYIVTVHHAMAKVVRIVANFDADSIHVDSPDMDEAGQITGKGVTAIRPRDYYVKYDFLPPIDGGFWGTGFGLLLGDLSHAINSGINILID
ncbi:MAG: hypothetical protein ACPGVG_18345, partial [Mycobacterium sp.]